MLILVIILSILLFISIILTIYFALQKQPCTVDRTYDEFVEQLYNFYENMQRNKITGDDIIAAAEYAQNPPVIYDDKTTTAKVQAPSIQLSNWRLTSSNDLDFYIKSNGYDAPTASITRDGSFVNEDGINCCK